MNSKFGIAVSFPIPQHFYTTMPLNFAIGFRACCVAIALAFVTLDAAEPKRPSLIGATREQVLDRLGEPRSNIAAGNREVLFFARERVVLRDNVVIEVEQLPAEPPRRPPPPPVEAAPAPAAATAAPDSNAPAPAASETAAHPEAAAATTGGARTATAAPVPPTIPEEDAPLVIKSVRPAGASSSRPAPATQTATPPPAVNPAPSVAQAAPPADGNTPVPAPVAQPAVTTPPAAPAVASGISAVAENPVASSEAPSPAPGDAGQVEEPATPAATKGKKAKAPPRRRARDADLPDMDPVESVFTPRTYLIAFIVIGGGVGFLIWRRKQRQLELAATSVSRTPFLPTATTGTGARFTPELLAKLDWKRFEELVASYYCKTGVVAVRTKSGPAAPVHIKISWKGEPRPFACVHCIARPAGLVDAKPLQELFTVISAEDIRRGYMVTTGKFNVPARDFAEEKHLTLLPGDIFLEKLNALPDTARNELMQEITTGDHTTPSCPKCEAKMVRSPDDPAAWRCSAHPDVTLPA